MDTERFESVDEGRRQGFEGAWLEGEQPEISLFLPAADDPKHLGTLEELVHIDMEFRWKQSITASSIEPPPSAADYATRFPELKQAEIWERLLLSEFELKHRFGDQPTVHEFFRDRGIAQGVVANYEHKLNMVLAQMKAEARPDRPGDTLGPYKLVAEHGRGGFGAVWRADDTKIGRRIALKRLSRQLSRQAELRRRFLNEARITAKLEHPGIVPIYDISSLEEESVYYAMKLVRGKTLAEAIDDWLASGGSYDDVGFRRLLTVFLQVCQTMRYCHDAGVLHRDLKPQNIIVGNFGESIVVDWGLACFTDVPKDSDSNSLPSANAETERIEPTKSLDTGKSGIKGTPAYMAPEQAAGLAEQIGVRTDVYGLGAMLYHILTGRPPSFQDVEGGDMLTAVEQGLWRLPQSIRSSIPKPLNAVCCKAMSRNSDDRYKTVSDLARDVENYLADSPVSAYPEPWTARTARWMRRHPTAVASSVLSFLFFSIAALVGMHFWQEAQQREQARIAEIRSRVDRADAMAQGQLESSHFKSALAFWNQASELVSKEPKLAELATAIHEKRNRIRRIDDFYTLSDQSQTRMFFDQLKESASYCQAGLNRLGVLDHADWWNHLPDNDLSPIQIRKLREQVYRQLGVLATMRIADQAEQGFSLDWFTRERPNEAAENDLPLVKSAIWAAEQGNRFWPARALQIVAELGNAMTGDEKSMNLVVNDPLNPTDAAMLGSILDTHRPADPGMQQLLRPFLGMREPAPTARQWLLDAISNSPDWHWLSIFIGTNELKTNRHDDAIRSFSHAIGIESENWVAYMHRALAHFQAANAAQNRRDRQTSMRNAKQDFQRANDLEKENPFLHWFNSLLSSSRSDSDEFQIATRKALLHHPAVFHIQGIYFAKVSRRYMEIPLAVIDKQLEKTPDHFNLLLVKAMLSTWISDFELAISDLTQLAEQQPQNGDVIGLLGVAKFYATSDSTERNAAVATALKAMELGTDIWLIHYFIAEQLLDQIDRREEFQKALSGCQDHALTEWQRAATKIMLARFYLRQGESDKACEAFRDAIDEDLAIDMDGLTNDLKKLTDENLTRQLEEHLQWIGPKFNQEKIDLTIVKPALFNGDFELGLSFDWGNSREIRDDGIWTNHGDCDSRAEWVSDKTNSGNFALRIENRAPQAADRFGRMHQTFPVTPGKTYRVRFWLNADDLTKDAFAVGLGGSKFQPIVTASEPTNGWQEFSGTFIAEASQATLEIRIQGPGLVWLDDVSIEIE